LTRPCELRAIVAAELGAFHQCAAIAFHEAPDNDTLARQANVQELDRSWAVFESGEVVATGASYSTSLSIPGGELPCAAVSWLTVLPTHRRRGMLRQLVARVFDDAKKRGEPLAALWASGGSIYRRFGFGPAVAGSDYQIDIGLDLPVLPESEPAEVRLEPVQTAVATIAPVYERARAERGGMLARSSAWWTNRLLAGARRRLVVARDRSGNAGAYALYQTRGDPPSATVELVELVAFSAADQVALWSYLCGLELAAMLEAPHRPVDDPLPFLFEDIRRPRLTGQGDCLWLRLLDVPRALEQRLWTSDLRLILDVGDPTLVANHGRWLLEATGGSHASCRRIADDTNVDLELDVAELGAVYLGGVPLARLAAAGRVREHTPGSITAFDDALRPPLAPWTPEHF
jgi:predicted acetyltransferase